MMSAAPQAAWRLIDTGPLQGPANMAVDEALLSHFDREKSLPVLRLYGWSPPTFSLGRYQQAAEVLDLELCAARGVPVVRRITGGGVIYHAEELTYSMVCTPRQIGETGKVKASFARLCSFLIVAYGRLGLDAAFAVETVSGTRFGQRTPFCFAGKEEYDIVVGSRKLGGNAQRRTRGLIFQHGSIPLRSVVDAALPFLRQRVSGLDQSTVSLAGLGVTDGNGLKQIITESFAETMGVLLRPEQMTTAERLTAQHLEESKYLNNSWNVAGVQE